MNKLHQLLPWTELLANTKKIYIPKKDDLGIIDSIILHSNVGYILVCIGHEISEERYDDHLDLFAKLIDVPRNLELCDEYAVEEDFFSININRAQYIDFIIESTAIEYNISAMDKIKISKSKNHPGFLEIGFYKR